LSKTFVLVRNNQVQVEINGVAKSLAAGAGAVRIIEGKETWLGRLEYDLAPLALKPFAEDQAFRLL
jgi:7-keto-8-aminopelargonate synthetase-like enzyme